MGVIGKIDRVDARMMAELGARLPPATTQPLAAARRALPAQAMRRRTLVEIRREEATRLHQTADRQAGADIFSLIALLGRRIAKVEAVMTASVKASP
ncbi:hypothetical protein MFUR16E_17170 [Methylobacterium fujisawaense]|uniref:hypothetical protein n=1 Tax=Methylobacterium fujisawaense TaxID=107400 RepID=UPI002F2C6A3B